MYLSSLIFLFLFLPVFLVVYWAGAARLKLPVILTASVIFLASGQKTALLWLTGIMAFGYLMGLMIAQTREKDRGSLSWLWAGITINLIILSFFKESTTYGESGLRWLHFPENWVTPAASWTVPLGLSYVIFQTISYLVDVWRGTIPAEKNLVTFSAYLLFFPKLISGPITPYKSFTSQLYAAAPSYDDIALGFRRLFTGFIKRILIANQLALMANAVFDLPSANIEPKFAWLALIAYTLQIFFDFSGYSDMAVGLGLMIGIRLPENFNFPYIAQNVSDFWRRWHMTLSTWFREYVFFPLERRRFRWAGQQLNILFVFLLIGLWHGFKYTFLIWGLLHGFAVALESLGLERLLSRIWEPIRHLYTLVIVMTGWVFFRSNTLEFSFEFFKRLTGNTDGLTTLPFSISKPMPLIEPSFMLALVVGILLSLPTLSWWNQIRGRLEENQANLYIPLQFLEDCLLVFIFVLGIAMLLSNDFLPNIYAKF
jgi:alginate O-acetyltransferase complex protein AlgI